jgi:hypothetical protein
VSEDLESNSWWTDRTPVVTEQTGGRRSVLRPKQGGDDRTMAYYTIHTEVTVPVEVVVAAESADGAVERFNQRSWVGQKSGVGCREGTGARSSNCADWV